MPHKPLNYDLNQGGKCREETTYFSTPRCKTVALTIELPEEFDLRDFITTARRKRRKSGDHAPTGGLVRHASPFGCNKITIMIWTVVSIIIFTSRRFFVRKYSFCRNLVETHLTKSVETPVLRMIS